MTSARHDKLAKFVGVKAYEKAGGALTHDLFAEKGEDAVFFDTALLTELAQKKLAAAIEKEIKDGWKWGENATDMGWQQKDAFGKIEPTLSADKVERSKAIETRLDEIGGNRQRQHF